MSAVTQYEPIIPIIPGSKPPRFKWVKYAVIGALVVLGAVWLVDTVKMFDAKTVMQLVLAFAVVAFLARIKV